MDGLKFNIHKFKTLHLSRGNQTHKHKTDNNEIEVQEKKLEHFTNYTFNSVADLKSAGTNTSILRTFLDVCTGAREALVLSTSLQN